MDGSIIFIISTIIFSSGMYAYLLVKQCKKSRNRNRNRYRI